MTTQAPAFQQWLDAFFAEYYRHRPVNATFIGVHDFDDRLPDFSEAGVDACVVGMADLQRRLRELPDEPLSAAEAIDRQLAEGFLEIQQWEFASRHFQRGNPCVYTGEAIFGVLSLFLRPFAPFPERVASAVARLEAIPTLLAQGQANVRAAPTAWTQRAIRECDGALAFLTDGIDRLCAEHGGEQPQLRRAADRAAAAFSAFRAYLQTDLLAHPVETYACGPDALDLLLRRGHFLAQGAEEIERYAWSQFEEANARLAASAAACGVPSWSAALAQLTDLHPTTSDYYARYTAIWDAAKAHAEAHDLVTWPDYPIRYIPQPVWARQAAPSLYFLFYRAPAAFDRVPVVDYLVTPIEPDMPPEEQERRLRAHNDSVIKLNHVIHHGGLGHHVQNWYAYNRAASRIGQVAAVDCASRIAMFCGGTMAEGWACYATELMDEFGFLTPLERVAETHSRLRMAARAIVDVRLHTGAFTLDEAAAFYRERVGMSDEAVKNSMFPGTALMYLVGTDLIHDLRRTLAARQGAGFHLRQFHDAFLAYGSVPVSLIADAMLREIEPQPGSASRRGTVNECGGPER
ncbi:DUF885 family protein [Sphaerobacter sp.]|uniref:DUF885 family protein n=1 Tax=Sphaerobacter sp. TaxID=2099654 RepID=UPI001D74C11E|nr:DUF885 family protein [Sphaerobacter sp.]MBX5446176.1 DUF885 domain-containing protein [Sphaerobacter sp.]